MADTHADFFTQNSIGFPCYYCCLQQSPIQANNKNKCHLHTRTNYSTAKTSLYNVNEFDENCEKYGVDSCNENKNSNENSSVKEHTCTKAKGECTCNNSFLFHFCAGHFQTFGSCLCCSCMPSFFPPLFKCYNHVNEQQHSTTPDRNKESKNEQFQEPNGNVTHEEQGKGDVFMPCCHHLCKCNCQCPLNSHEVPVHCQNQIYCVPLIPVWIPSHCHHQHFFHSHCSLPEQQINVQSMTHAYNANNSEHKIGGVYGSEGSLSVTSLNADTDVENLSDNQNSYQLPWKKSSSLPHITAEHKCDINGNEQFEMKEKYATDVNNSILNHKQINKTKETKYKSRIPKIIKTELRSFKKNAKDDVTALSDLEIMNENEQCQVCDEPVTDSRLTLMPEQILHDKGEYGIPINELNSTPDRSSQNEIKLTIYQSKMHSECVSLNMLNVKNKIINESQIVEKPQNMYLKYTFPEDSVTDTLDESSEYMMKHNSTSEGKLKVFDNFRINDDNITNERELLQHDGFPSPEIDLDLMALQLLINSQTFEDETMKDTEDKHDPEKEIYYKFEGNVIDFPIANRNSGYVEFNCEMSNAKLNNPTNIIKDCKEMTDMKSNGIYNDMKRYNSMLETVTDISEECCNAEFVAGKDIGDLQECHKSISYSDNRDGINENVKQPALSLPLSFNDMSSTSAKFILSYLTKVKSNGEVHNNCVNAYVHNIMNDKQTDDEVID